MKTLKEAGEKTKVGDAVHAKTNDRRTNGASPPLENKTRSSRRILLSRPVICSRLSFSHKYLLEQPTSIPVTVLGIVIRITIAIRRPRAVGSGTWCNTVGVRILAVHAVGATRVVGGPWDGRHATGEQRQVCIGGRRRWPDVTE